MVVAGVTVAKASVTLMPVRSTLPILVTTKVYSIVSPTSVIPLPLVSTKLEVLVISNSGCDRSVTVGSSGSPSSSVGSPGSPSTSVVLFGSSEVSVTVPPPCAVPDAIATLVKPAASISACNIV